MYWIVKNNLIRTTLNLYKHGNGIEVLSMCNVTREFLSPFKMDEGTAVYICNI